MRIRWTPAAAADLQRISDYLREHHPHYRQPTMRKLYETIGALNQWLGRGRLMFRAFGSLPIVCVTPPPSRVTN